MSNVLILFGASGDLGRSVLRFSLKDPFFSSIIQIKRGEILRIGTKSKLVTISAPMKDEKDYENIFDSIKFDKCKKYFLFNAIGGFLKGKDILTDQIETYERMFEINYKIPVVLTRLFVKNSYFYKAGSICFISSFSSLFETKNNYQYNASKNALNRFIESTYIELRESNISINGIAPYIIDTEENRGWVDNPAEMTKPEEIYKTALFFFQNYKFISGNIIRLNGKK